MQQLLLPLKTIVNPYLFNLIYSLPLRLTLSIFTLYILISSLIIATYYNITFFPQVFSDISIIINSTLEHIPSNARFEIKDDTLTTENVFEPLIIYPQEPLTFFNTQKALIVDTSLPAEEVSPQNTFILFTGKAIGLNVPKEPLIFPYSLFNQEVSLTTDQIEQHLTQYQASLSSLTNHRYWLIPLIHFVSTLISQSVIALIYALPLTAAAMISRRPRNFKGWLSVTLIALSITQILATAYVILYGQENSRLISLALTILLLIALYVVKNRPFITLKRQPEKGF